MRNAARKRGTVLQFLAQNFTRHKVNTSRYNHKINIIHWRIEWVFPNVDSDPVKFVDAKCPEQKRLSELLDKYLNPEAEPFEGSKALTYYKSVGFSGVKVLLRGKYFPLFNLGKTTQIVLEPMYCHCTFIGFLSCVSHQSSII